MNQAVRSLVVVLLAVFAASGIWMSGQEPPTRIVLMHTNDIHGQLQPRNGVGGIAQIGSIIRSAAPDLVVDAGDLFTGTFLSDEFKGVPTIAAMNAIGYTSGTIGNHEFDYGQDALRMRVREAKFPLLSANVQSPIAEIKPYTVVTVKDIRIGILGLTTQELKKKTHPDNVIGIEVQDVVEAVGRILPELRSKSDLIIASVHLEDDEEIRVAKAFPEIRLMVGGHTHATLGPYWLGQTVVVKTGSSGRNVGRVDLEFGGKKLTAIDARLIPVTDVDASPDVESVLAPFEAQVAAKMTEVVGEARADLWRSSIGESPLANLVADSFREKGKTDVALHNVGGIRANIVTGRITWGNAFEVLPFQNRLITLKITGAQLKKTLLVGLDSTIGLMAISGLRVRFDRGRRGPEQLVSLTLADGTTVDDAKLYSVTTNDFVVAGGDGYTELGQGIDTTDTGILLRDVFVEYIRARRSLSPITDGRIAFN